MKSSIPDSATVMVSRSGTRHIYTGHSSGSRAVALCGFSFGNEDDTSLDAERDCGFCLKALKAGEGQMPRTPPAQITRDSS